MEPATQAPVPAVAMEALAIEAEALPSAMPAPIDAPPAPATELAAEVSAEEPVAVEGSMQSAESNAACEAAVAAAAGEADDHVAQVRGQKGSDVGLAKPHGGVDIAQGFL